MKYGLASLRSGNKPCLVAAWADDCVLDVACAAAMLGLAPETPRAFDSPKALLEAGAEADALLRKILDAAQGAGFGGPDEDAANPVWAEGTITFLPPIPDPEKFLCVGKNYRAHLDELVKNDLIAELPKEPTAFVKLPSVLVEHGASVARPDGIVAFDYEPELAFVIGKPGYRVGKADAQQYIAGVTLLNDLTAREIQKREVVSGTRFWTAKNMPGFGPVGRYIVTMDEVADFNDLWITCHVNGELRQRFNTCDQINRPADIIEHFSRYMPMAAGDIFATGAAAGTAFAQPNADELFLKPGDRVEIGIEGLLSLATQII